MTTAATTAELDQIAEGLAEEIRTGQADAYTVAAALDAAAHGRLTVWLTYHRRGHHDPDTCAITPPGEATP